jgi:hypothetical protein
MYPTGLFEHCIASFPNKVLTLPHPTESFHTGGVMPITLPPNSHPPPSFQYRYGIAYLPPFNPDGTYSHRPFAHFMPVPGGFVWCYVPTQSTAAPEPGTPTTEA